jgi:hypothetical protein
MTRCEHIRAGQTQILRHYYRALGMVGAVVSGIAAYNGSPEVSARHYPEIASIIVAHDAERSNVSKIGAMAAFRRRRHPDASRPFYRRIDSTSADWRTDARAAVI